MNRLICAFCVLTQTVSWPAAQRAAAARPSIGTGASRWLPIVRRTTTSQPSNADSSAGLPAAVAMFEPAASNSSAAGASAASGPITAGSGA
jgi:hypothetical protein